MVFLEKYYELLLMLHLLVTFALIGSMSHNLLIVIGYMRGKFNKRKLEIFYAKISLWIYAITYVLGALIYPAFRVYIRGDFFDPSLPWATGLFEVKEHWGALGLAFFFAYYILRRNFDPEAEREKLYLYVPLCLLLNLILWYKTIIGCYLAIVKGTW
jgi:hypothetical protein